MKQVEIMGEVVTFDNVNQANKAIALYNRVIAKSQINLNVDIGFLHLSAYLRKKDNPYYSKPDIHPDVTRPEEELNEAFACLRKAKEALISYKKSVELSNKPLQNEVKHE